MSKRRFFVRANRLKRRVVALSILFIVASVFVATKLTSAAQLATLNPSEWVLKTTIKDQYNTEDGKTELNWDASDGGYGKGPTNNIVVQVSYKNESTSTSYKPGELEIRVPNLIPNTNNSYYYLADVATHLSYTVTASGQNSDEEWWTLQSTNTTQYNSTEPFIFVNKKEIPMGTSFQGTLQIVYAVTPNKEDEYFIYDNEATESDCTHENSYTTKAILNGNISSDNISFNYKREYNHPWQFEKLNGFVTARKIEMGFLHNEAIAMVPNGKSVDDYYWVAALVEYPLPSPSYPHAKLASADVSIDFPDNVLIYDVKNKKLQNGGTYKDTYTRENNTQELNSNGYNYYKGNYLVLAYPKSAYSKSPNNRVTITRNGVAHYGLNNTDVAMDEKGVSLYLPNYEFKATGELYSFKNITSSNIYTSTLYYSDMLKGEEKTEHSNFSTSPRIYAKNTGQPIDIEYEFNYVAIRGKDSSQYQQISEDDYYITNIDKPYSIHTNDATQEKYKGTLEIDLYTKKRGEDYKYAGRMLYTDGVTEQSNYANKAKTYFSKEEAIVGYKLIFKNVNQDIDIKDSDANRYQYFETYLILDVSSENFPNFEGTVSIAPSLRIKKNGAYETLDVEHENFPGDSGLLDRDSKTYGNTIWRAPTTKIYINPEWNTGVVSTYTSSYIEEAKYNTSTEKIHGTTKGYERLYTDYISANKVLNFATSEDFFNELEIINIAPKSAHIVSTPEQIKNSFDFFNEDAAPNRQFFVYKDNKPTSVTREEMIDIFKKSVSLKIVNNLTSDKRDTVIIKFNFTNPVLIIGGNTWNCEYLKYEYDWRIAANDYAKYGPIFNTGSFVQYSHIGDTKHIAYKIPQYYYSSDITNLGIESTDYNRDGVQDLTTLSSAYGDYMSRYYTQHTYNSSYNEEVLSFAISTFQGLLTLVKANDGIDFTIDPTEVGVGKNYQYRNRVQTGDSPVTDLVVYSNLETAYGDNAFWQGSFVGIDTSYAENVLDRNGNRIYAKVYYSEKSDAKKMSEDNSWKPYTESVDKSKVKSIAVEYVDASNKPAILPLNTYVHFDITLKSPSSTSYDMAYMNSFTSWAALDNQNQKVGDITGVTSNIVNAYLEEKVSIHLHQSWEDFENKYKLRPKSVTYRLKDKSGKVVNTKSLNIESGESETTFDNIDYLSYKDYTIESVIETAWGKYYTSTSSVSDNKVHYYFKSALGENAIQTIRIRNIDEKNRLVGSNFTLKNTTTNETYTWTQSSDTSKEYKSFELPTGYTYELVQTSTPSKYYPIDGKSRITINDNGTIQVSGTSCTTQTYCFTQNTTTESTNITVLSHTIIHSMTVDYIDVETNQKIPGVNSQYKEYEYGNTYNATVLDIDQYTFQDCNSGDPVTGTITTKDVHVICKYKHKRGNIVVLYIDKEKDEPISQTGLTNPVATSNILTGTKKNVEPINIANYTQDSGNKAQEVTVKEGTTTIKYYYIHEKGSVTVKYLDKDTLEVIHDQVDESGLLTQTTYKTTAPAIDHYVLDGEADRSVPITTTPKEIIFYYIRNKGLVTVRYIDIDTQVEFDNSKEDFTKRVGEKVTTSEKQFENYKLVQSPETEEYEVKEATQTVKYFYRRDSKLNTEISKDSINIDQEQTVVTSKDQAVNYTITYNSKISDYKGPATIVVVDTLPFEIDEEQSELDGGVYDSDSRTITWTKTVKNIDSIDTEITEPTVYNISVVYVGIDPKERTITNSVSGTTTLENNTHGATTDLTIDLQIPGKITTHHVDENGKELVDPIESIGLVGDTLTPEPIEIKLYYLVQSPEQEEYEYTEEDQDIYYVYKPVPNAKTEDNIMNIVLIFIASILGVGASLALIKRKR